MTRLIAVPLLALALAGCVERLAVSPVDNEAVARIEAGLTHRCAHEAARAIAGLGLGLDDIRSIQLNTETRTSASGSNVVQGHRAWVRLVDQPGHVVVTFNPYCSLEQAYLEGGARLPGA